MPVNDRFKELIKTLSFTPNSLSKELNVTQPTIKKLEKGETLPNAKVLIPLLERYNVNINWLLGGQGEMFLENLEYNNEKGIDENKTTTQIGHYNNGSNSNTIENTFLKSKIELLEKSLKDKEKLISILEKNQR
jgi:transcriptional regulator with XRE-family HTH domain